MPGWRNWQTQRTQNPPTLAVMGVRPPLPAPTKQRVYKENVSSVWEAFFLLVSVVVSVDSLTYRQLFRDHIQKVAA